MHSQRQYFPPLARDCYLFWVLLASPLLKVATSRGLPTIMFGSPVRMDISLSRHNPLGWTFQKSDSIDRGNHFHNFSYVVPYEWLESIRITAEPAKYNGTVGPSVLVA